MTGQDSLTSSRDNVGEDWRGKDRGT